MDNNPNRIRLNTQDAVAVDRARGAYGVGAGLPVEASRLQAVHDVDFLTRLYFMVSEITGLLFVILSTFYIFAVPKTLTRSAGIRAMLGRIAKRLLDIVGASIGLVLSVPVFVILPILIKLESPGPVFYTQLRVGQNRRRANRRYCQRTGIESDQRRRERRRQDCLGRPFYVIKFRTMVADAEKMSGPVWAKPADPRITRLGALLRKTRLDEVPQFINILRGDMSLVGPRPERPHFVKDLSEKIDGYAGRLNVKPGLTGLAQIEVGYDSSVASVAEKVRSDLTYIRNWSFWYDIKILLRTVIVVLTGRGAC
jgi:lipopolysaccharide/colanic/teichoic acid biosynthesis glycosyltransferase